jgi:CDP-glycerol glycerophosphotransferase
VSIKCPELSVVIPVYNTELYLEPLLESIAGQTLSDLEVIMVDDGSTDDSRRVAEEFTLRDPRFRLFCQANAGSGPARNAGVAHATGRYLAFADCDDIVVKDAYARLTGSLKASGSVLASGGVRRLARGTEWSSPLHEGIFDMPRTATHITRFMPLLGDRTVWNKVYDRAFWDARSLLYPGHPFEDGCLAVRAHILAPAVDVLAGPVYLWRDRDEGPPSTVQRTSDARLLRGRMEQVRFISAFLAEHSPPLAREYDRVALEHDILILVTAVPDAGPALQDEILQFAAGFADEAHPDVVKQLARVDRECYQLVRSGDLARLLDHLAQRPVVHFL